MNNSNKTWKQAFAEVNAMRNKGLQIQANNLMKKLNTNYNRNTKISLDKYLFKYGSTLQPNEFDELINLLKQF